MKLNVTRKEGHGTDNATHVPWWVIVMLVALILATLIILAINTHTPLVLIGEAVASVLLATAALIKALGGEG